MVTRRNLTKHLNWKPRGHFGNDISIHRNPEQGKRHRPADRAGRGQGRDADCRSEALSHERGLRRGHGSEDGRDQTLRGEESRGSGGRSGARDDAGRGAADRFQGGDRRRSADPEEHRRAGAHLRADRQTGDLPEGSRGGARYRIPGVFGANRRTGELHHQAGGRSGLHAGPGKDRSQAAEEGAVASGRLQRGRPRALRDQAGGQVEQGSRRAGIAGGAGAGDAAVRTGSPRDLRRHGSHQGLRAGGRRAHQDRGAEPRPRCGQRGRLRRNEGDAGAIHHPRTARREDRHHRIFRRPGGVCDACA